MSDAVLGDIASTTSTLSELLADSEGAWPTEFSISLAQQLKGKVASAGVTASEAAHLLSLIQRACDQVISCDRTNPLVRRAFQLATTSPGHYTVEKRKRRGETPPPPPISAEQFLSQRVPTAAQIKRLAERLVEVARAHVSIPEAKARKPRFKPGPCPKCESSKTRVSATKNSIRHLACKDCGKTWQLSKRP